MQKKWKHYRETDITCSPKRWATSIKKLPILLLQSKKMKGYTLQQTIALPLHSLTVYLPIQYNTIHSHVTMLSFIGEIPWENATVNPIPWVCKTVGQHTSQNFFSRAPPWTPSQGEWVYSTPGVQTQLNNISGSGRLGSTTNNLPLGDRSQQLHCYYNFWTML